MLIHVAGNIKHLLERVQDWGILRLLQECKVEDIW
jgi:hypothetical protein